MYCSNCGAEIADGSKFCEKCGSPTSQAPVQDASAETEPIAQPPVQPGAPAVAAAPGSPNGSSPKLKIVLIVIGILLIIIGLVRIATVFMPNTGGEPSVASSSASTPSASSASSSASSSSSAPKSSSSSAKSSSSKSSANMQTIGNRATGSMQVPNSWTDNTSSLGESADSTEAVFFVDPSSEYTSGTFSHFMYSRSALMRVYPTSYSEIAAQAVSGYNGSEYGAVDYQEGTFCGHKSYIITTSIPEDNVNICDIAVDRDDNDTATVLLTLWGTPSTISDVLGYASTWQY